MQLFYLGDINKTNTSGIYKAVLSLEITLCISDFSLFCFISPIQFMGSSTDVYPLLRISHDWLNIFEHLWTLHSLMFLEGNMQHWNYMVVSVSSNF